MSDSITIDNDSRTKIIDDLNTNFFVKASAGSGKTFSLTTRMVALVENGVPVNKICTITFTKAAANEFFDRFQKLLSKRSNPETEEELKKPLKIGELHRTSSTSRERCQEALNNIDLCFMGTLDSFCNMIAHEHPNELNIPKDSEVISAEQYNDYIRLFYNEFILNKNHKLHDLCVKCNTLFDHFNEKFVLGIKTIIEHRHHEIVYEKVDHNLDLKEYFSDDRKYINDLVETLLNDDFSISSKDGKKTYKEIEKYYRAVKNNDWDHAFGTIFKLFSSILKFTCADGGGTESENKGYIVKVKRSYLISEDVSNKIAEIKSKINEYSYSLYMELLVESVQEIAAKLREQGLFTFFDFLLYLRDSLKESSNSDSRELIEHIFKRHSYFLIDESQDTNPMQTEVFFYLTGSKKTDDWKKTEPKPGSLFIVGDPKQSIYRFRNADVESYLDTEQLFKPNERLILSKNFRSNREIREWFNASMNDVLDSSVEKLDHPDIPESSEQERLNLENSATFTGVFKYFIHKGSSPKKEDADRITDIINTIVDNPDYTIVAKKDDTPRLIKYSDIMVVPSSTSAEDYISAFEKKNIPLTIEAKLPFSTCPSLTTIKTLFYSLIQPENTGYFINVLESDLFKYDTNKIINLCKEHPHPNLISFQKEITVSDLFKKDIEWIESIYKNVKNMPYSSVFLYLIEKCDLFKTVDTKYLELLYYVIELIREGENNLSIVSSSDAIDLIEKVINATDDKQRTLRFKSKINRVKIANVHKVKGLQAPIVILAQPSSRKKEPKYYIDKSEGKEKVYFFGFGDGSKNDLTWLSTNKYDKFIPKAIDCREAEIRRLEYVAATRPESVLIVSGLDNEIDDNSIDRETWKHLLNNIPNKLDLEIKPKEAVLENLKIDDVYKDYQSIKENYSSHKTYNIVNPSENKNLKLYKNNDAFIEEDEIEIPSLTNEELNNYRADIMGTIVHRLMEFLVKTKNRYPLEEAVDSILNEYEVKYYKDYLLKIGKTITNGGNQQINGTLPNDILSLLINAEEVQCEVPFSYKENDNIFYGVIDCIYKDNGKYHIIDYKTDKENDVSKLLLKHKNQLDIYVKVVNEMYNVNADYNIYHIDIEK